MGTRREEIESFHATGFDFDPRSAPSTPLSVLARVAIRGTLRTRRSTASRPGATGRFRACSQAPRRGRRNVLQGLRPPDRLDQIRVAHFCRAPARERPVRQGLREFAFTNRLPVPVEVDVHVHGEPGSPEPSVDGRSGARAEETRSLSAGGKTRSSSWRPCVASRDLRNPYPSQSTPHPRRCGSPKYQG